MSPTSLAARMGRTERTVYNWLQSLHVPRDAVALLSDALEIPVPHLWRAAAGEADLPPRYRAAPGGGNHSRSGRAAAGRVGRAPLEHFKKKGIDPESLRPLRSSARAVAEGRRPGDEAPAGDRAANYDATARPLPQPLAAFQSVGAGTLATRDVIQLAAGLGDNGRFKVRVQGCSMADDYPDGCWVVFSRPQAQAQGIVDNKDYLVWTTSDESTFKRVVRDPYDPCNYLLLRPLNPDRDQYAEQRLHRQEVAYVARAVQKEIAVS